MLNAEMKNAIISNIHFLCNNYYDMIFCVNVIDNKILLSGMNK